LIAGSQSFSGIAHLPIQINEDRLRA